MHTVTLEFNDEDFDKIERDAFWVGCYSVEQYLHKLLKNTLPKAC